MTAYLVITDAPFDLDVWARDFPHLATPENLALIGPLVPAAQALLAAIPAAAHAEIQVHANPDWATGSADVSDGWAQLRVHQVPEVAPEPSPALALEPDQEVGDMPTPDEPAPKPRAGAKKASAS